MLFVYNPQSTYCSWHDSWLPCLTGSYLKIDPLYYLSLFYFYCLLWSLYEHMLTSWQTGQEFCISMSVFLLNRITFGGNVIVPTMLSLLKDLCLFQPLLGSLGNGKKCFSFEDRLLGLLFSLMAAKSWKMSCSWDEFESKKSCIYNIILLVLLYDWDIISGSAVEDRVCSS